MHLNRQKLRKLCEAKGLTFRTSNQDKHWMIRGGPAQVNYWPGTSRVHVSAQGSSRFFSGTEGDLVKLALAGVKVPDVGVVTGRGVPTPPAITQVLLPRGDPNEIPWR